MDAGSVACEAGALEWRGLWGNLSWAGGRGSVGVRRDFFGKVCDSVIDWTAWCEERGIRFLHLAWVDSGGVLRAEAVSARQLASIGLEGLPVASAIQVALPLDGLAEDEELTAVGQGWLVPDP